MSTTLINTLADRDGVRHPMLDDASGCGGSCSTPPQAAARLTLDALPIRVDGFLIDEAEIAREIQHHEAENIEEARAAAARALVIRYLLLKRAGELALAPEPETDALGRWESDEEALVRRVLEQEAPPSEPTQEECRRVYEARRSAFPLSFDKMEPVIRDRLKARAWVGASTAYVARLVRSVHIEGLNILGESGP